MWKKISFMAVMSLSICPSAAMAALNFDPFAGIVQGIAQGLVAGEGVNLESAHDMVHVQGGNVVVAPNSDAIQQGAEGSGDVSMSTMAGQQVKQAVNTIQVKDGGEVPVLMMQGASFDGKTNMVSNSSSGSVQAVNLVTSCSGEGCQ